MYTNNNRYICEYILTGNVNTNASSLNLLSEYTKREWSKYVNEDQHATFATVLTKSKLDEWYNRYIGQTNADTSKSATFRIINGTKYDNLINNYSYYWMPDSGSSTGAYDLNPETLAVNEGFNFAGGVRPVVFLSSEIQLAKVGTKTLVDPYEEAGPWTYNVWNIK